MDFQKLFEASPALCLVLNPELIIVGATDAYLRATMTERRKILGRGLFEVFPDNPDELAATGTTNLRASLKRVLDKKVSDTMAIQRYDVRRPESEGGKFVVKYWSPLNSPVLDSKGDVEFIIHRVEDVTDFETVNQEYGHFFSGSLDLFCIAGSDGVFKKVNPAFERALGYTKEELCTIPFLDFVHPEDIEKTKREVEKQVLRGEPVLHFENRYRRKDGSYRIFSWRSTPVGSLMHGSARDVTEMRQAEEDLRNAKERADLANRELEAFSYSVAHDLRSPLRSMMGFSNVLLEDHSTSLNAEAKGNLLRVVGASKKMGLLIDALLSLSQITRKKLAKKEFDLSSLTNEILTELLLVDSDREVSFVVQPGLKAYGDPVLLRVVLSNLLGNAWKYTSKVVPAKIEFGSTDQGGATVFYVQDNGAGFDMKYVDQLFGVFRRLHSAQEFEGIGIGLATVQRIIHGHGGRVWAEGVPGQGAKFYFTLLPEGGS